MPFKSKLPDIDLFSGNILSYLFPPGTSHKDEKPLWIDAKDPDKSISASQTRTLIGRLALGLDRLQIPKNTAVMVVAPNNIYVPLVYLTAAGSGRFFTAANPAYTVGELVHQMKTIRAEIVLADSSSLEKVTHAAREAGISKERIFDFSDNTSSTDSRSVRSWWSLLASETEGTQWQWDPMTSGSTAQNTVAVVNFSSGTTGLPKGVCITHAQICANATQIIHARMTGTSQNVSDPDDDRWLAFLPWYHAYAQMFTIMITCKLRQSVYAMAQFQLEPYIEYIGKYQITTLQVVPPVLVMLNKRPGIENCNVKSVKYVMSAAAPLKRDLQNDIARKLGTVIAQSWGMTETTCTGTMYQGLEEDRTGSVGCLLPNTEAKLVDEDEKEVETGKSGEFWVRGPQMMLCYWENQNATKSTLTSDGWLKTGDVAEEKDGRIWIVDRRKELIKVRGFQVAPAELEAVLLDHSDVADCAVVGLAVGDDGEERPRAYIALQKDASSRKEEAVKAIEKHFTEKVARHKRLTGGISVVESIPRLLSGKIQRKVVKEWAKKDSQDIRDTARPKL